jgi:hypothetical protein
MSANAEAAVYDPNGNNITNKFEANSTSIGFLDPMQLIDLLYIVSNLT